MNPKFFGRAFETLREAYEWYRQLCTKLGIEPGMLTNILLAANFLSLRELVESIGRGGQIFDIRPYRLTAGERATLVVDIERQGRVRDVAIWVDSAVGLPDPTIRVSTDASSTTGGGIRVKPGDVNELGQVPANSRLYAASDVDLTIYVLERG